MNATGTIANLTLVTEAAVPSCTTSAITCFTCASSGKSYELRRSTSSYRFGPFLLDQLKYHLYVTMNASFGSGLSARTVFNVTQTRIITDVTDPGILVRPSVVDVKPSSTFVGPCTTQCEGLDFYIYFADRNMDGGLDSAKFPGFLDDGSIDITGLQQYMSFLPVNPSSSMLQSEGMLACVPNLQPTSAKVTCCPLAGFVLDIAKMQQSNWQANLNTTDAVWYSAKTAMCQNGTDSFPIYDTLTKVISRDTNKQLQAPYRNCTFVNNIETLSSSPILQTFWCTYDLDIHATAYVYNGSSWLDRLKDINSP